jgi:flavin-dependent dehydrogenase
MPGSAVYDCAVIGGGLAGLTLAIQLRQQGFEVILFEKESYPSHKVCGEYIGMESYGFLERCGIPLSQMNLPRITQLNITAPNGKRLSHTLAPGGFGISRFTLDKMLADIAERTGVLLYDQTKVTDVVYEETGFRVHTTAGIFSSKTVVGSYGKRSNLDVKWKRSFMSERNRRLNNYIGVKYHVKANLPDDTIELHNFKDGYCGISKVDDERYCLCYLSSGENLKKAGNSINEMERMIVRQNPFLEQYFSTFTSLYEEPLAISQISFEAKSTVENHVLMAGDAAGLITPLCGNGMSMAMHAADLLAKQLTLYFEHKQTRTQLEQNYTAMWQKQFGQRLMAGRLIQGLFGSPLITNLAVSILKPFPSAVQKLVKLTHGKPF